MKQKNNILLMIVAVVALIATVGGATYAYFASSITPGEGLNLDITAEASTAQFTATGGNFGFTVTGANMQQGLSGSIAGEDTATLVVELVSEKEVTCTFDVKFAWDTGSGYTPTTGRGDQFEFGITMAYVPVSAASGFWYGAGTGGVGIFEEYVYSINFDKLMAPTSQSGFDGYILKGASLHFLPEYIGNGHPVFPGKAGVQIYFKVSMYNLSHDQSALAGNGSKTYSGRFYVDNVVC